MTDHETLNSENSIPFYPDHVKTEFKVVVGMLLVFGAIAAYALFSPVGVGDPADPMVTPAHVKPEWYFLALYQLLKYIPKTIGATLPVLAVLLVLVYPFIDRKKETTAQPRRVRLILTIVGVIVLIAMTIWGEIS